MGLTVAEAEVFDGAAPVVWTDLNLSGTIGSNPALVILKVNMTDDIKTVAVRKNGDTDEQYIVCADDGRGLAVSDMQSSVWVTLLVLTDSGGIMEWKAEAAANVVIDIIGYFK